MISTVSVDTLARFIRYYRNKFIPNNPQIENFQIDYNFLQLHASELIVSEFRDSKESLIVAIYSLRSLNMMRNLKTGFCDGTFEIVPKQFSQLYSFNGFVKNLEEYKSVPLAMFLCQSKSKETYIEVI